MKIEVSINQNVWHTLSIMVELFFKRTGRLFANPSLMEGMSRVLDILGTHDIYNVDDTPQEADYKALYSDWAAVGDHIILAAKDFSQNAR